jgi:hypothetical protein
MNADELRAQIHERLDVDKNNKVNVDDVIALAAGNTKKLLFIGIGIGLAAGVPLGAFLF